MSCPEESVVIDFVEGSLESEAAELFHSHLDGCAMCQRLVAEVARSEGEAASGDPLQCGGTVDRYVILRELGIGGMGVVYAAFDPQLDRKVALKLLRPGASGASAQEQRNRLLAEAQALARLSHPNVVSVHEAKGVGEQVFVAMELVEGQTLGQWLQERPRPWREIIRVFLEAGRGLQAAHDAGLVHRDFKPDNVLIGKDGRVVVTDFGLARIEGRSIGPAAPEVVGSAAGPLTITRTGTVLGTPAYMAPEQWSGSPADSRTDQFSFCVALYQALYGVRPFQGNGPAELMQSVRRGEVMPPSHRTSVPARVRKALLRGLQVAPQDRFPSIAELLAALSRDPLTRWRMPLALGSAVVLVALGAAIGSGRGDPRALLCKGGERKLAAAWGPAKKEAVREALLSTATPNSADTWSGVERALDGYASAWVAMHTDACEATRVRGEQSEVLLDLRVTCLERRARDLEALTNLFVRARGQAVEHAVQAAYGLPPLKECAETDALAAQVKLPKDPAMLERVRQIDVQLSEVRARVAAGKYATALEQANATAELARGVAHPPTRAEAFYQLALLRMKHGEAKPAREALQEAIWAAEEGRSDRLAARARIDLVRLHTDLEERPAVVMSAIRDAQAALARLGADADMESSLETAIAGALNIEDKCEDALPHLEKALALADRAYSPDDPRRASILSNIGTSMRCVGKLPEALQRYEEALRLRERTFGPQHPEVAASLSQIGAVLFSQQRYTDAHDYFERALAIQEQVLGKDTAVVGQGLINLGVDLIMLQRNEEGAAALRRALALYENVYGKDSPKVAFPLTMLGHVEVDLGNPEEACRVLERALRLLDGRDDSVVATARFNLARALRSARKDERRARGLAVEARQYFERRKGARQFERDTIDSWLGHQRKI